MKILLCFLCLDLASLCVRADGLTSSGNFLGSLSPLSFQPPKPGRPFVLPYPTNRLAATNADGHVATQGEHALFNVTNRLAQLNLYEAKLRERQIYLNTKWNLAYSARATADMRQIEAQREDVHQASLSITHQAQVLTYEEFKVRERYNMANSVKK